MSESIYDYDAPSGNYLKFKHGTVARVRLFGEPVKFEQTFQGQEPKTRFASLVLWRDKDRKVSEVKCFAFGWSIQKVLKALVKDADWGDPTEFDVEVTATGDGLDREYQVVPKPKAALSKDDIALIAKCDWSLEAMVKPKDSATPAPAPPGEYDPLSDSE